MLRNKKVLEASSFSPGNQLEFLEVSLLGLPTLLRIVG